MWRGPLSMCCARSDGSCPASWARPVHEVSMMASSLRKCQFAALSAVLLGACSPGCNQESSPRATTAKPADGANKAPTDEPARQNDSTSRAKPDDSYAKERQQLLDILRSQGITDERVLDAIRTVPRHELVPKGQKPHAYENRPLPIGEGQTISQPYIVGLMTQVAQIQPDDKVLEVGTGSGYQAAILSELAEEVYTIEIVEPLAQRARRDLERLGFADNIHFRIGDGFSGWSKAAPFDAILVTAAPPEVPEPLERQLKMGGRLVIPVGDLYQELRVLEKTDEGVTQQNITPVRFVPMTGKAQER